MFSPWSGRIIRLALAVLAGLCWVAGGAADAEEGIQVDNLKGIYAAAPMAAAEKRALSQLQQGMKLLYAVTLPAAKSAEGGVIILGKRAALASGLITQADLDKVGLGGYVIKTAGDKIAIAGSRPACTYYGVVGFLERLGVRFYDGPPVVALKPAGRTVPGLEVYDKPALIFRTYATHALAEWANPAKALKADVPGKTDQWIDHSAGYLVPKDLYYDKHPEYYSMLKSGKRIAKNGFSYHRTPLCLSNPDVTNISIERALKWIAGQPEATFFPITYGDTANWCQCPKCLKLDAKPGNYAERVLQWVNPVARAIGEKYPDKIVVTFAYGGSDAPPMRKAEKNVYICKAVPLAGLVFHDHSKDHSAMRGTIQALAGWNKAAPGRVGVCEYFGNTYQPVMVDQLQGICRFYLKHNVNAVYYSYGRPKNFPGLWRYLYAKLMWDPKLDAHAIAREYVKFHYKPAKKAEAILDYLELVHQRYRATLGDELDKRSYPHVITFYSKDFADKALACLERAGEKNEMKYFILDWMAHPVSKTLTRDAKTLVRYRCDLLGKLADDSVKGKTALAADLRGAIRWAERAQKGAGAVIKEWMKEHDLLAPTVPGK